MCTECTTTPYFPDNLQDYAPWVAKHGLTAPYGLCQCGCGQPVSLAVWGSTSQGRTKGQPLRFVSNHAQRVIRARRIYPKRTVLWDLYIVQGIETDKIAEMYGVDHGTVFRWLKNFDIKRPTPERPTKEQLEELYLVQKINSEQIGQMYNVSGRTIRNLMTEYGIPRLGPTHLRKGRSATWNVGLIRSEEAKEKNRQAHLGREAYNKGQGDVQRVCEACGKEYITKQWRNKRTCSIKCLRRLMTELRGEQHWNYKGDDATFRQRQRLWVEFREWRIAIMKRFAYTCYVCGQHGGRLSVHHLYTWNDHPEYRLDPANGVCLCWECHWSFHRAYGHHHTTPEMFTEWLATMKRD